VITSTDLRTILSVDIAASVLPETLIMALENFSPGVLFDHLEDSVRMVSWRPCEKSVDSTKIFDFGISQVLVRDGSGLKENAKFDVSIGRCLEE
jgi:hypothetical protein